MVDLRDWDWSENLCLPGRPISPLIWQFPFTERLLAPPAPCKINSLRLGCDYAHFSPVSQADSSHNASLVLHLSAFSCLFLAPEYIVDSE